MSFPTTRARRSGSVALIATGALLTSPALASAAPGASVVTSVVVTSVSGPCEDGTGITVVVDFTDLDGEVEVGCAPDAATGTEALTAAGFVDTRDAAGLICAIDASPDPCPTTWEGSWWSYWHAAPDGEWEFYEVGSDASSPVAGEVEGWRYHDGSEGPTLTPAAALDVAVPETGATPEPEAEATPEPEEEVGQDEGETDAGTQDGVATEAAAQSAGPSPTLVGGVALLLVLVAAGAWVARRRGARSEPGTDEPGTDEPGADEPALPPTGR